jgi:hypothetical protein
MNVTNPPMFQALSAAWSTFAFTVGKLGTSPLITAASGIALTTTITAASKLPPGIVVVSKGNGAIALSGTPAAGSGGVYSVTFTATNATGSTTQTFPALLVVNQPAPTITSPKSTIFTVGQSGTFTVTATGYASGAAGPFATLSESTGVGQTGLPAWATFTPNNNGTATITGQPTAPGTSTFTITASVSGGTPVSQVFTLVADQPPTFGTPTGNNTFTVGQVGNTYTIPFTPGSPPVTTVSLSGKLPTGVTYTVNQVNHTIVLIGVPAAGTAGIYNFSFNVANSTATRTTAPFVVQVDQAPVFTSAPSAIFTANQPGSFTVKATGYPPPQLSLTAIATFTGTVIINKNTVTGIPAASMANLAVGETVTGTGIPAGTTIATIGTNSITLSKNATASGVGVALTAVLPNLPGWLSFHDNGNGTATIAGTPPTIAGSPLKFQLSAVNFILIKNVSTMKTALQIFSLVVDAAPVFKSTSGSQTQTFTVGSAANKFQVSFTPGVPAPITLTESGKLPAGLAFSHVGGTATISGAPLPGTGGTYTITITASSSPASSISETYTLTVIQPTPIIAAAGSAILVMGQSSNITVKATGYSSTSTPASLSIGSVSGTNVYQTPVPGIVLVDNGNGTATITGTPMAGARGIYTFSITATVGTKTATEKFTLTVDAPPVITSGNSTTFSRSNISQDTFVITTPAAYPLATFAIVGGAPPTGVILVNNGNGTATLKGTPAAITVGKQFTFLLAATSGTLKKSYQTFTIDVVA